MKNAQNNMVHNSDLPVNGEENQYVRVFENGVLISFLTVNNDWCVINTKMGIRKGKHIVETMPFINCRAMLMHLSDFNNWFPGLNEIPVTTKWPFNSVLIVVTNLE